MKMKIVLLTISFILSTVFGFGATAEEKQRVSTDESQQRTASGSIRGCRLNLPHLQVLAPDNRITTHRSLI